MQTAAKVKQSLDWVSSSLPASAPQPSWAITLGTGLSEALPDLEVLATIRFSDIPGFPAATVSSHAGHFKLAVLEGVPVWLQCGRVHLYEGHSPSDVVLPVRLLHGLGVRTLLLTNAAGCLHPAWQAGELMVVSDHINMTGRSPLTGPNEEAWGPRFPDMCRVYSPRLQEMTLRAGKACGVPLRQGVYMGVHGPQMETPAETRAYRMLGADAIGMSTVPEAIAATHLGMEIGAISILTNKNMPACMAPASLEDVIAMANKASGDLALVLATFFSKVGAKD